MDTNSFLDDMDEEGIVTVTIPSHVPPALIDKAISKISRTEFGRRSWFTQDGNRVAVRAEPMAFVDSAVEHLVDVVRALLTDTYKERPTSAEDDGLPF